MPPLNWSTSHSGRDGRNLISSQDRLISHHDLRPAVRNRIAKNSYRYCRISFQVPTHNRGAKIGRFPIIGGMGISRQ
jgi:hypothetical protein